MEIHSPGRIEGEINSPALVIDKGAVFSGISKMPDGTAVLESDENAGAPSPVETGSVGNIEKSYDVDPASQDAERKEEQDDPARS